MNKFVSSGEIHEAWVEFINDSVQFIPQVIIYRTNIRNGLHPRFSLLCFAALLCSLRLAPQCSTFTLVCIDCVCARK